MARLRLCKSLRLIVSARLIGDRMLAQSFRGHHPKVLSRSEGPKTLNRLDVFGEEVIEWHALPDWRRVPVGVCSGKGGLTG